MRNTAYSIHDGKIVHRYNKMCDGGDGDIAKFYWLSFAKGVLPGLFKWNGLKIGIEICADGGILEEKGIEALDLQVLVSCGQTETTPCAKYTLINDGQPGTVMVLKKGRIKFTNNPDEEFTPLRPYQLYGAGAESSQTQMLLKRGYERRYYG